MDHRTTGKMLVNTVVFAGHEALGDADVVEKVAAGRLNHPGWSKRRCPKLLLVDGPCDGTVRRLRNSPSWQHVDLDRFRWSPHSDKGFGRPHD